MNKKSQPPVSSRQTIACPRCGHANYEQAPQCWMCFHSLRGDPRKMAGDKSIGALGILGIIFGSIFFAFTAIVAAIIALFVICLVVVTSG